jgi:hypothetical protein
LREVIGEAKNNRDWAIGHTLGDFIMIKVPIKVGDTLGIVWDVVDRSVGSQRFYSMIFIYCNGRVSEDLSPKTGLQHHIAIVIMLYCVSEKVTELTRSLANRFLPSGIVLLDEQNHRVLFSRNYVTCEQKAVHCH